MFTHSLSIQGWRGAQFCHNVMKTTTDGYSSHPGWVLTSVGVVPAGPRPLGGGGAFVSGPVAVVRPVLYKAAERRAGIVEVAGGENG